MGRSDSYPPPKANVRKSVALEKTYNGARVAHPEPLASLAEREKSTCMRVLRAHFATIGPGGSLDRASVELFAGVP